MISTLIVDDHQVLLDGIKALIHGQNEVSVDHEALTGQAAVDLASHHDVQLILLDINLPDIIGFDVCKKIKDLKPEVKIIALTMHEESGYISRMIKAGVDGYLLKNTGRDEILTAIQSVMEGDRYLSQKVTQKLFEGMSGSKPKRTTYIQKITRREKEILRLIVDEFTTDEIAAKLFISSTTVISHRKSLLRKLNAKNTAGLVKAAFELDLLKEPV